MTELLKRQKFVVLTLIFSFIIFIAITMVFSIDKKTNRIITDYINEIGWQTEENPIEISHITIPLEFDEVYKVYNSIQQRQGFNLENYKGKTVARYTYKALNHKYSDETSVFINVLFFKGEIIASDISSNGKHSFIYELQNTSDKLIK